MNNLFMNTKCKGMMHPCIWPQTNAPRHIGTKTLKDDLSCSMDKEEQLLREAYGLFQKCIFTEGRFPINRNIQRLVALLTRKYGLTRTAILDSIYTNFILDQGHLKFDGTKSTFPTYIANRTKWSLLDLIKEYKMLPPEREIRLIRRKPVYEMDSKGRCSLRILESEGHPGLVNYTTPEDMVIMKELCLEAKRHFEPHELEVLMHGARRREVAEREGVDYDTYIKRLQRRTAAFREKMTAVGYC